MIGTGKLKSGRKVLYKDGNLKNAWPKPANSTPNVDILDETSKAYKVYVHSQYFNPKTVWIAKSHVGNVVMKKPSVKPSKPVDKVELFDGDKMVLYRGNNKLGEFTFKKG